MENWKSEVLEKLYKMCNFNTYVGSISFFDYPGCDGYSHYLLPNGIHAYIKPKGGDGIFTYEDIKGKYENSKDRLDPNDPYFNEKFPISDVYFERFTVPGTSNIGTQIVFGNSSISFDENGRVFSSHLEIPTMKGGYDTIAEKGSIDSIENIIKKMLDKYISFNFPENSEKTQLYKKALQLCSDMKALSNNPQIAPQDALNAALSDGVTNETIANIPDSERNMDTGGKTTSL